jgi:hypothetical protein
VQRVPGGSTEAVIGYSRLIAGVEGGEEVASREKGEGGKEGVCGSKAASAGRRRASLPSH